MTQVDVDEDSLSPEESKERKIMTLLLKIKNGTPPMRKSALRQITDKVKRDHSSCSLPVHLTNSFFFCRPGNWEPVPCLTKFCLC